MGLFRETVSAKNRVFDWDSYYADIERGISFKERQKKFEHFEYYVDKYVLASRKATA